ncbi:MAG: hypothetical protein ACRCYU_11230 [Nocardioides sp.]
MDAVAMRLLEIGESVQGISPELTATEPGIQRTDIAGMRDFLAHPLRRDESRDHPAHRRQAPLAEAVERMKGLLPPERRRRTSPRRHSACSRLAVLTPATR